MRSQNGRVRATLVKAAAASRLDEKSDNCQRLAAENKQVNGIRRRVSSRDSKSRCAGAVGTKQTRTQASLRRRRRGGETGRREEIKERARERIDGAVQLRSYLDIRIRESKRRVVVGRDRAVPYAVSLGLACRKGDARTAPVW